MYQFVGILCLISATISIKLDFNVDKLGLLALDLGPLLEQLKELEVKTTPAPLADMAYRRHPRKHLRTLVGEVLKSEESSRQSDEYDYFIRNRDSTTTTTAYTTKYESGTTKRRRKSPRGRYNKTNKDVVHRKKKKERDSRQVGIEELHYKEDNGPINASSSTNNNTRLSNREDEILSQKSHNGQRKHALHIVLKDVPYHKQSYNFGEDVDTNIYESDDKDRNQPRALDIKDGVAYMQKQSRYANDFLRSYLSNLNVFDAVTTTPVVTVKVTKPPKSLKNINPFIDETQNIIPFIDKTKHRGFSLINDTEDHLMFYKNQTSHLKEKARGYVHTNKTHEKKRKHKSKSRNETKLVVKGLPKFEVLTKPKLNKTSIKNAKEKLIKIPMTVKKRAKKLMDINHNDIGKEFNDTFNWNVKSHKVKENAKIKKFTRHILAHTMKLFDIVKKKSDDHVWKHGVDHLARAYEKKMKDFLRTTGDQEIKTRLGSHKVVLNAIDASNYIVNRILDLDRKGLLRSGAPAELRHEIKEQVDWEQKRACLELGICRTQSGFLEMIVDVLNKIIVMNDDHFGVVFNSLMKAIKTLDLSETLGMTKEEIYSKIMLVSTEEIDNKRSAFKIIKNIIVNRHKPVVMYSDTNAEDCNLNKTLGFLEILDVLEEKVPNSGAYTQKWYFLNAEMKGLVPRTTSMHGTMKSFVSHIKTVVDNLDENSKEIIRRNAKLILS